MFDDPQKELKRLEEEMLKLTEADEKFERFYQEIYEEYGPTDEEQTEAPAEKPVKQVKRTYADAPRAVAPKKKKSVKGLVITVCVEMVGILAIVGYWLMRLL